MCVFRNDLQRIFDSTQILGSAVPGPNTKRDDGGEFDMVSVPVQEEYIYANRFWKSSGEARQGTLSYHGSSLFSRVTSAGKHGVC